MARGDVVSGLASVAAWGRLVYQPPAGVEALVTAVAYHVSPAAGRRLDVEFFDGTTTSYFAFLRADTFESLIADLRDWRPRLLLTNIRYMRMFNVSGATATLGYTGIRTK